MRTEYAERFDDPLNTQLLSPCYSPASRHMLTHPDSHFHSVIQSPFTNKALCYSVSLLDQNKRSRLASAGIAPGMMDLLTAGFMVRCIWSHTWWTAHHWMSFIHTQFTCSPLGSFQLEAGVGPGHVDGQKLQIVLVTCPP